MKLLAGPTMFNSLTKLTIFVGKSKIIGGKQFRGLQDLRRIKSNLRLKLSILCNQWQGDEGEHCQRMRRDRQGASRRGERE